MKTFKVTYYANVYVTKFIETENIDKAEDLADDFDVDEIEDDLIENLNLQHFDWEVLDIDEVNI